MLLSRKQDVEKYDLLSSAQSFPQNPGYYLMFFRHDMAYLLTAIGLTPGGSSRVHIYT